MEEDMERAVRAVVCTAIMFTGIASAQPGTVFVDAGATGSNNGTSWPDAFTNLQAALAGALPGDSVWVAAGTYRPGPPGAVSAAFSLPSGVSVFGGFDGTESTLAGRAGLVRQTVLSGDLLGNDGVSGFAGYADNARHVVRLQGVSGSTLDGLTIVGGGALPPQAGGGIRAESAVGTIRNCYIVRNRAFRGGGIGSCDSALSLVNCVLTENLAVDDGGGILCAGAGSLAVINCTVTRNSATGGPNSDGGGVFVSPGISVNIVSSILWGNVADRGTTEWRQLSVTNAQVLNNCIEGLSLLAGNQNIGAAPLFRDAVGPDGLPGTIDDDLALQLVSPCIDAGDAASLPPDGMDLDGDGDSTEPTPFDLGFNRRLGFGLATRLGGEPQVDMGAFERHVASFVTFGVGCPAAGGSSPALSGSPPRIGAAFTVQATGLPMPLPFPLPVTLALSVSRVDPPVNLTSIGAPGCFLSADLAGPNAMFAADPQGQQAFWGPFVLPQDPVLVGVRYYNQAIGFGAGGLFLSNPAQATIGVD